MLLNGKTAFITGCNRGIGKALLEEFAREGASVWAHARTETAEFTQLLEEFSHRYSVRIRPVYFDLSEEETVRRQLSAVLRDSGPIDILVNNAGMISENRLFLMTPLETMRNVFEVNFFAQMAITQAIARNMMRQKAGSIVNISSIAALDGDPGQLEYIASKAALAGITKKLAKELQPLGIRVNAVAPGLTDTDMIAGISDDLKHATLVRSIKGDIQDPVAIARIVVFLVSDRSAAINGEILRADG